jgi:hypothetical protein
MGRSERTGIVPMGAGTSPDPILVHGPCNMHMLSHKPGKELI